MTKSSPPPSFNKWKWNSDGGVDVEKFNWSFERIIMKMQMTKAIYVCLLTSLSPSRSTLQCRKAVCPIVTVKFFCTSISKYGAKYEAGSVVDEKLSDSVKEKEIKIDEEISVYLCSTSLFVKSISYGNKV